METGASSLDELTVSLPAGFYTTFSTLAQGTRVLGLSRHLKRLYRPAKVPPARSEDELRRQISRLVTANLPGESRIRLILIQSSGEIYIGLQAYTPLPRSVYENGVHAVTSEIERRNPHIKGTDFITQSAAQRKQLTKDVFEILLVKNGLILEGMTSNFYAVNYKPVPKIITAGRGILAGITRRVVLSIARKQGISIDYHAPLAGGDFDEAFLTSSSRGVVPIVQIDGSTIREGEPGQVTYQLSAAYEAYVQQKAERIS